MTKSWSVNADVCNYWWMCCQVLRSDFQGKADSSSNVSIWNVLPKIKWHSCEKELQLKTGTEFTVLLQHGCSNSDSVFQKRRYTGRCTIEWVFPNHGVGSGIWLHVFLWNTCITPWLKWHHSLSSTLRKLHILNCSVCDVSPPTGVSFHKQAREAQTRCNHWEMEGTSPETILRSYQQFAIKLRGYPSWGHAEPTINETSFDSFIICSDDEVTRISIIHSLLLGEANTLKGKIQNHLTLEKLTEWKQLHLGVIKYRDGKHASHGINA